MHGMDDVRIYFEAFELVSAAVYILYCAFTRKWSASPITTSLFLLCLAMLIIDVFYVEGKKDTLAWLGFNVPFFLLCYEKIYRNDLLAVVRGLAAFLTALLGL